MNKLLVAFFISMLPVSELRGGMIFASASGIPFVEAFLICFLGNILPVPFLLLFVRRILTFLERFRYTKGIVTGLESRVRAKSDKVKKYQLFGLFLLVAVPLPGTGAWTGALVAAGLDHRIKRAFPMIALGVFFAGIIMSILSYLVPGLFFE